MPNKPPQSTPPPPPAANKTKTSERSGPTASEDPGAAHGLATEALRDANARSPVDPVAAAPRSPGDAGEQSNVQPVSKQNLADLQRGAQPGGDQPQEGGAPATPSFAPTAGGSVGGPTHVDNYTDRVERIIERNDRAASTDAAPRDPPENPVPTSIVAGVRSNDPTHIGHDQSHSLGAHKDELDAGTKQKIEYTRKKLQDRQSAKQQGSPEHAEAHAKLSELARAETDWARNPNDQAAKKKLLSMINERDEA